MKAVKRIHSIKDMKDMGGSIDTRAAGTIRNTEQGGQ